MDLVNFFLNLFDTSDFPARWHCGRWTDGHGWLHVLSDIGVWSAYFAIPAILGFFVVRRKDLPFRIIFVLFVAFILFCGLTHLMEAVIFWWPAYRLAGVIKFLTAVVSWTTVFALVKVGPQVIRMRAPEELEREIEARKSAEAALQNANVELERRVGERTAELRADREWFSTTLGSIGDGVITTGVDGRVITLNRVAETLTGWTQDEAAGRMLSEVFVIVNAKTRQPVENPALRALEQGTIVGLANHTILAARDGVERFIDDSAAPIKDDQGAIVGAVLVFRDISQRYLVEQARQDQYDLTKTITDNATTGILMVDEHGACTFMNPAAEAMTGFSFAEAEDKVLHDLIHHTRPDGSPYLLDECPIERALPEHHDVRDHEDQFFRKSGEAFPVMCNARPIFKEGRAAGTVIEIRDLTREKLAEEELRDSESRFQQLADVIPNLTWMARPDGHIEWYNTRWYEYTGATWETMQGWGWQSVHDPEILPQVLEGWRQSLATGEPFEMVFPLRGVDGRFRPFLTRVVPFRDAEGGIVRWFGTNTDIGELEKTQKELRQIAARLSEADRRKDEFLATLAHELRNPLAPIRTGLEVMRIAHDDPARIQEVRGMLERQTAQLITLVDDLLDVSRITRGKLKLRKCPVNAADVAQSAVETSRPFIDEAGHELTVALPDHAIHLDADPHRLAQVISNLLNNAAKYTPNGGRIWLTVEREGDELRLAVRDDGIGISPDKLEQVFEMFTQVDHPVEKNYTGLGVGLTLVRSLVEMHGGKIDVHSEGPDQGSEFCIRLPLLTEESPMRIAEEVETPAAKRRVLVVDDNSAAAKMLKMVVELQGHEVRTADNGREAIDVAAEFLPDVVLMDLGMPQMDGYEAAQHLRKQPWGRSMLLVALTGWGQDDDKEKTRQAGFDLHLTKPAEPAELSRILAQHHGEDT
ncbi:MAG: PAS domain S-box protein [Pirellulaceae bacterium]